LFPNVKLRNEKEFIIINKHLKWSGTIIAKYTNRKPYFCELKNKLIRGLDCFIPPMTNKWT
jgi:hypothetical protein